MIGCSRIGISIRFKISANLISFHIYSTSVALATESSGYVCSRIPCGLFLDRSLLKTALNAVGISDNDLYVTILKKDYPRVGVILVFALIQSQLQ